MDLSNLSSDLPPTKPISQASINELNRDLTTEFKNAAKSVASLYNASAGTSPNSKHKVEFTNAAKSVTALYRLSNTGNGLHRHMGYLECLDDLLSVITNGEDIENWALTKRAEITNVNSQNESTSLPSLPGQELKEPKDSNEAPQRAPDDDLHIPLDYAFSFSLDITPGYHFRPSFPPLSVNHSYKQRANFKQKKTADHFSRMKKHQKHQKQVQQLQSLEDPCSTSDEEESDATDKDHEESNWIAMKKKSLENDSDLKRRKLNAQRELPGHSPKK